MKFRVGDKVDFTDEIKEKHKWWFDRFPEFRTPGAHVIKIEEQGIMVTNNYLVAHPRSKQRSFWPEYCLKHDEETRLF